MEENKKTDVQVEETATSETEIQVEKSTKKTLDDLKDKAKETLTKENLNNAVDAVKENLTKENLEKTVANVKENLTKENLEKTVANVKESLNEENREETIKNIKSNPKFKKIITIVAIFLVVIFIFKGCGGGPSDEEVISCAKTLICKHLKSPSSAIFSGEEVVDEDDYGRYCIKFLCEASNSFGGSIQNYYIVVLQSVDSDGSNFKYLPSVAYQTISPSYATDKLIESVINNVKQANGWNEEPKENDGD